MNIKTQKVGGLKNKFPEGLSEKLGEYPGTIVDRRMLYVCRSSVYFTETKNPDPKKLKS